MVVVHDDNKPRLQWRLAVIEELIRGRDGHAPHIRMSNINTTRPLAKLYPLKICSETRDETEVTTEGT